MSVISLNMARVKRTNDPQDWTMADMLRELLRRLESGEIQGDVNAVIIFETESQIHALTAGTNKTVDEVAALAARGIRVL